MNSAPAPAVKGEPPTGDMAPFASIAKAETVPEPELLTKAKLMVCPDGVGEGELFIIPQLIAKNSTAAAHTKAQIDENLREGLPSGRPEEIIRTISGAGDS
jgi:hypothetical protein